MARPLPPPGRYNCGGQPRLRTNFNRNRSATGRPHSCTGRGPPCIPQETASSHLEMIGRPAGNDLIVSPQKGNGLARGNITRYRDSEGAPVTRRHRPEESGGAGGPGPAHLPLPALFTRPALPEVASYH